jgi:hypothetical protein
MCGRLKCCLNYELDTYIDALEDFPDRAERLKTNAGLAILIKTDVFKRLMFYTYAEDRGKLYPIHVDQIWEAIDMIKSGKFPGSLEDILAMAPSQEADEPEEAEPDFENVHDVIQLPIEKRNKRKKKRSKNRDRSQSAAAAVEKASQNDAAQGRRQGPAPRRHDRPQQGGGGNQGQGGNRGPQNRPDQKQGDRPRQDSRPPNPNKNQGPRPPREGGNDRPNRPNRPEDKGDKK